MKERIIRFNWGTKRENIYIYREKKWPKTGAFAAAHTCIPQYREYPPPHPTPPHPGINSQPEPRIPTALRDAKRRQATTPENARSSLSSELANHAPDRWNVSTVDEKLLAIMHASVDSRRPNRDYWARLSSSTSVRPTINSLPPDAVAKTSSSRDNRARDL